MTPDDLALLWRVIAAVGVGNVLALVGTWAVLKHRVAALEAWKAELLKERKEEREKLERTTEAERAEAERQRAAWWAVTDALEKAHAALTVTCSNATTELRTMVKDLKERVDLHSGSNVANLAGVVRNYSDMVIQTLDTLRETLREARAGK